MAVGPVVFAGRLGKDAIGEAFVRLFAERGVDTARLQRDSERPSRVMLVRRSSEGERQFRGLAGNAGNGFADQALEPAALPQARWLLIGTLPLAVPKLSILTNRSMWLLKRISRGKHQAPG